MISYQLQLYAEYFKQLRVGNRYGKPAISKPVMLLCIIDLIALNKLEGNRIYFENKELISRFDACYRSLNHLGNKSIIQFYIRPFYHLSSEPFYDLVWKKEEKLPILGHTPTTKYLHENLKYAKLDVELWELLQDKSNREYLKEIIIHSYLK